MHRFKKLADFGKVNDNSILVNKGNYTLLQDIVPPEELEITDTIDVAYQPCSKLKATLRPYQEEGVKWLVKHNQNQLGACLADDMGLGKTLQTIATLVFSKEQLIPETEVPKTIKLDLFSDPLEIKTYLKALIVLPSSLVFNWAQEILKFAPHLTITKYVGSDRKKIVPYLETYDIILTTYTTLSKDISILQKTTFTYLVTDESQQIKNKESKIFKAINKINAIHKISLSGTPIENSLSDLWSQMEFINPGILGSYPFFKDHFKIPIEKHQNEDRIKELKTLIDPFILRRTKEQVAKDLPELSEQIIYTEMLSAQEKTYESQKSAARNLLLGIDTVSSNKIHIINTLTKLRQLANHPKLLDTQTEEPSGKFKDVSSYLETLVKSNKKVLIFSSFVSHLNLYQEWCKSEGISFVSLTGQTKSSEREKIVHEFQENDSIPLFFISLKAGGVGLNLTKASYVVLLDPWWNPFIEKQAIARAHRIGQKNNVMVTRFITKNTIEEKILKLQEQKQHLSDEIIDINTIPDYIESDLLELLK
ncbi:DEAD/DEAH box helicase [Aquimarina rubra]|uniref:DEAD/DEAH box helicase n=1 Tax=Aquimarina rubra TaxID=1920033 RepID=A0ABW5LJ94_9FLAO